MTDQFEIPDFDQLLGGMLEPVKAERRPLLIAMLERMAAARYRQWAELPDYREARSDLLACADREEEIATRIEALYPDAAALQQELIEAMPELAGVDEDLFGGRSVRHQFAVLAAGERSGGRVWAQLAEGAASDNARQAMRSCGPLEEANADVLDRLLAAG